MHKAILGIGWKSLSVRVALGLLRGRLYNYARFVYRFRTPAFHVGKTGSIPVSCTISKRKSVGGVTDYQTSASHMQEL